MAACSAPALEDDMRRLAELPLLGVVLVCITWVLLSMFVPLLWIPDAIFEIPADYKLIQR